MMIVSLKNFCDYIFDNFNIKIKILFNTGNKLESLNLKISKVKK